MSDGTGEVEFVTDEELDEVEVTVELEVEFVVVEVEFCAEGVEELEAEVVFEELEGGEVELVSEVLVVVLVLELVEFEDVVEVEFVPPASCA